MIALKMQSFLKLHARRVCVNNNWPPVLTRCMRCTCRCLRCMTCRCMGLCIVMDTSRLPSFKEMIEARCIYMIHQPDVACNCCRHSYRHFRVELLDEATSAWRSGLCTYTRTWFIIDSFSRAAGTATATSAWNWWTSRRSAWPRC